MKKKYITIILSAMICTLVFAGFWITDTVEAKPIYYVSSKSVIVSEAANITEAIDTTPVIGLDNQEPNAPSAAADNMNPKTSNAVTYEKVNEIVYAVKILVI